MDILLLSSSTHKRRRGRPPKELAGYSETREALLSAGVVALTTKGFSATGIEESVPTQTLQGGLTTTVNHRFGSVEFADGG